MSALETKNVMQTDVLLTDLALLYLGSNDLLGAQAGLIVGLNMHLCIGT